MNDDFAALDIQGSKGDLGEYSRGYRSSQRLAASSSSSSSSPSSPSSTTTTTTTAAPASTKTSGAGGNGNSSMPPTYRGISFPILNFYTSIPNDDDDDEDDAVHDDEDNNPGTCSKPSSSSVKFLSPALRVGRARNKRNKRRFLIIFLLIHVFYMY